MTPPAPVSTERTAEIGESIGQYRLVGVMADVSHGRLYVAERQGIRGASRTVSLLCVRPEAARDPQFRTRFQAASRLAPRIQHPNVPAIYEMGEVGGNYFISMEYVPGESLASILKKSYAGAHLSPDIAATLVKLTANAAQYIQDLRASEGFTTGPLDVDPLNIFVTYHGTVKLLGVCLHPPGVTQGYPGSGMHEAASSPLAGAYRAPEELAGTVDARTDVFRLGVMLWTCLTGRPPHRAYGSGEADAVAPSRQMVPPSSVRAEVPEALDVIATRSMSMDASERYQSVRTMSEALEHWLVRRESRPTHMHIRRWMERQLFDPERASLQRQIAEGCDVEVALSLLRTPRGASGTSGVAQRRSSPRPRELWSMSHSVVSRLARRSFGPPGMATSISGAPQHEPLPVSEVVLRQTGLPSMAAPRLPSNVLPSPTLPSTSPRRGWLVGVLAISAIAAAVAVAIAVIVPSDLGSPGGESARGSSAAASTGEVDVRSVPEGAAVFVDGEPTGLRTPVVLKGLANGRTLRLRVEKPSFAAQERAVTIAAGAAQAFDFDLLASEGRVRFAGAPADARIYVDDVLVSGGDEPVRLPAGRHTVRVETQSALTFSDTVVIVAGEQTIRVDGAAAKP